MSVRIAAFAVDYPFLAEWLHHTVGDALISIASHLKAKPDAGDFFAWKHDDAARYLIVPDREVVCVSKGSKTRLNHEMMASNPLLARRLGSYLAEQGSTA